MPSHHFPPFEPHPLVRGSHAQTLVGAYLPTRHRRYQATRRTVTLADGDALVLHDDCPPRWRPGDRSALLIHGLGGCHESGYMRRIAHKLNTRGVRAFRMDLRGCGAGAALARLPYHSGRSEDAAAALEAIAELAPRVAHDVGWLLAGRQHHAQAAWRARRTTVRKPGSRNGGLPADRPGGLLEADLAVGQSVLRSLLRAAPAGPIADALPAGARRGGRVAGPTSDDAVGVRQPVHRRGLRLRHGGGLLSRRLERAVDRAHSNADAGAGFARRSAGPLRGAGRKPKPPPVVKIVLTESGGHLGFIGRRGVDPDSRWMDWRVVDWVSQAAPAIERRPALSRRWRLPRARERAKPGDRRRQASATQAHPLFGSNGRAYVNEDRRDRARRQAHEGIRFMQSSIFNSLPSTGWLFFILILLFGLLIGILQIGILGYAYEKMGISRGAAYLILFCSLVGAE